MCQEMCVRPGGPFRSPEVHARTQSKTQAQLTRVRAHTLSAQSVCVRAAVASQEQPLLLGMRVGNTKKKDRRGDKIRSSGRGGKPKTQVHKKKNGDAAQMLARATQAASEQLETEECIVVRIPASRDSPSAGERSVGCRARLIHTHTQARTGQLSSTLLPSLLPP